MNRQRFSYKTSNFFQKVIDFPLFFHLILWLLVVLILSVLTSLNGTWPFSFYLLNTISVLPALLGFSYTMDIVGMNLFFGKHRHFILFLIIFVVATISFSLLIPGLSHIIMFGIFYPRVFEPLPWFNWRTIPQNLIILWFPYFILSIKTFFVNWFKSEKERLSIENKRLLAEIQLMKIKLHPHFLFNTLNNLYAMSKINCQNSSEYILKLSEIYRTMLYECNQDFYPLREELALIQNYIDLEKIRYDERLKLQFAIPTVIDDHLVIPPLLLFTFVENAFKHGCRHDVGNPFIDIEVRIDEAFITFESKNSVPNHQIEKSKYGGIGLENTQKRLQLIFEDEYTFEKDLSANSYSVFLKIPKLMNV